MCDGRPLGWLALVEGSAGVVLLPLAAGSPPGPERTTPACTPLRLEASR